MAARKAAARCAIRLMRALDVLMKRVSILLVVALAGCSVQPKEPNSALGTRHADEPCVMGEASMDEGGTITANLATRSDDGIAHRQRTIAPSHPDYPEWLAHLHGLQPGESKAIPCLGQQPHVASRLPPFLSELPWIFGLILTALAVNYCHTYWGSLALRDFDVRRIPFEPEADYQKRRGNLRIYVAAVLALGVYIAAVKQSHRPPGGGSTLLFFIALCCVYFGIWSLIAGIKIRMQARRPT